MLPAPVHHVIITSDMGGDVADYSARVSAYLQRRVTVRVTGDCVSACTMVAALPPERLCVAPRARFAFHQAFNPNPRDPNDHRDRNETGTAIVLAHYPPALVEWIDRHGGLGPDFITLQGAELGHVFRICPRRDR